MLNNIVIIKTRTCECSLNGDQVSTQHCSLVKSGICVKAIKNWRPGPVPIRTQDFQHWICVYEAHALILFDQAYLSSYPSISVPEPFLVQEYPCKNSCRGKNCMQLTISR